MIGRVLSHYEVLSQLGAGGMGEVYLAEDRRLGRKVALKVLPAELAADAERLKRLEREARTLGSLDHPNIVTLYSVEEAEGIHFLTMAYVEGESLAEQIPGDGMPVGRLLEVATALADALAAAHAQGVVHRDLKPGNVMVDRSGRVRVLDFGLAKAVAQPGSAELGELATRTATADGMMVGTLPYMSPEQAEGRPVDARSDLFSLGTMLYELATGRRPFGGASAMAVASAILKDTPGDLRELRPDLPASLVELVERCLEKDRERRMQTAQELLDALSGVKRELDSLAYAATTVAPAVTAPRRSRVRWGLAAAIAVVVLVASLIGFDVGGIRERLLGPRAAQQIQALAVLPLENLSGDSEQDYLADGLTDALITDLTRLGALHRVIARSSVMRYRTTDKPLSQIAMELNVDALLTGAVLRSGERVRVTAQLIDPGTGEQLWAERYERDLRDVLALQNEVVAAIARAIRLQLTPADRTRLARARTVDPEAYESYLRGRFHLDKRTQEGLQQGLKYFQAAIDADPRYALGYVGLADAYRTFGSYAEMPPTEAYPRAKAALAKALEIDGTLAEARLSLAEWHYDEFNSKAAEEEFRRALELNPNFSSAHHLYAVYLGASGRQEEAIQEIKRALELDPLSPVIRGAELGILFHARRYDETISEAEKLLDLKPPFKYFHVGSAYIEKGMTAEGVAEFEQEAAVTPGPVVKARLGYSYARAGRRTDALRILGQLQELSQRQYVPSYEIALLYAGLGDKSQSLAWLEKAYENREGVMWLHFLKVSPCFDGVRDSPRFQELLRRMNFPS